MKIIPFLFYFVSLSFFACGQQKTTSQAKSSTKIPKTTMTTDTKFETATLGAGCFWCVEAVFQRLEGVEKVVSGYSGGFVENPTYRAVCDGTTGHAEVCQVTFDPKKLSFQDLLVVFFATHDPTTPNQQGNSRQQQHDTTNHTNQWIGEGCLVKILKGKFDYVTPCGLTSAVASQDVW